MRFHEFCLFVCTTPALGMVALKLEKDFDDRFLLYYFLSLSLPLYRSLSLCSPAICLCLSYFLLSLSLSFLFLSLPPSFFLPPFSSLFPLPLKCFEFYFVEKSKLRVYFRSSHML